MENCLDLSKDSAEFSRNLSWYFRDTMTIIHFIMPLIHECEQSFK